MKWVLLALGFLIALLLLSLVLRKRSARLRENIQRARPEQLEKGATDIEGEGSLSEKPVEMTWSTRISKADEEMRRSVDDIDAGPKAGPVSFDISPRNQGPWLPRLKPEMPTTLTDRVHFSVTAPPEVAPGAAFVLDIWAHLERQRGEIMERARQHIGGGAIFLQEKGPVRITRGTVLAVRVQVEGMVIPDPEDTILWEGEIGSAGFPVQVPKEALPGPRAGTARFYVNAFEVAKLHFALSVGRAIAEPESLSAQIKRYRSAFASYASEDNDEVLNILQGIKMGMPDLDVFYAEASLRAGEHWPERLKQEIMSRDIFYLFWSRAASVSPWVDMEWRFAYEKRGIDVIKPVPLAPPHVVPPPPELAAELHFNDWVLAHKRQAAGAHS